MLSFDTRGRGLIRPQLDILDIIVDSPRGSGWREGGQKKGKEVELGLVCKIKKF